ncbi:MULTISPECIES: NADP-dependent oxidoreductase [unclassified Bradyrhizobium]|uniref:NADP-dependent oxidoreductase n=1 Tax=unclassified Bradyrhizobium TaxID=2631580 RepID=UPI0033910C5F
MSTEAINRQWILTGPPHDRLTLDNFGYRESSIPDLPLRDGQVRIRNVAFRCAPTMRNWMEEGGNGGYPSMPVGEPVIGPTAGLVLESANSDFRVGDRLQVLSSWQDYAVLTAAELGSATKIPIGTTYLDALGRYGLNPLTAYFGLLRVGEPKPGETLVVSAAAGSTGSIVAQIGKIKGMRVIGIAGGVAKCDWLHRECRVDATIDYKTESVARRLEILAPGGIDIYYDNVGGEILQAAVNNMAHFGRIVLCGQISTYDTGKQPEGPRNMMRLIYRSIRMQGFLCSQFQHLFAEAIEDLRGWTQNGKLVHREHTHTGFELLPIAFLSLLDGTNEGTVLVETDKGAIDEYRA